MCKSIIPVLLLLTDDGPTTFKQGLFTRTLHCILKGLVDSVHSLWFHIIALQLIKLLSFKGMYLNSFKKKKQRLFFFLKKGYVAIVKDA